MASSACTWKPKCSYQGPFHGTVAKVVSVRAGYRDRHGSQWPLPEHGSRWRAHGQAEERASIVVQCCVLETGPDLRVRVPSG
ncbi:MAG: hypothetical protein QOF81_1896 [Acidimicrobiaceae bacterium]|nr:hypothetical protein [Acidimicrobiaceae bacterium]